MSTLNTTNIKHAGNTGDANLVLASDGTSTFNNDVTIDGDLTAAAGRFSDTTTIGGTVANPNITLLDDGKLIVNRASSSEVVNFGTNGLINFVFGSNAFGSPYETSGLHIGTNLQNIPADSNAFIQSDGKCNAVSASLGAAYRSILPGDGYLLVDKGVYIGSYAGESLLREVSQGSGSNPIYIGNQQIQVSSDIRLKTDINDTEIEATERLKEVRVVDFAWDDPSDEAFNNKNARGRWTGVIAQELVDVFPFAVNAPRSPKTGGAIDHDSEQRWNVNQDQLVPVLIKGFQEQQARIEALEATNASLEARLTALEGGSN